MCSLLHALHSRPLWKPRTGAQLVLQSLPLPACACSLRRLQESKARLGASELRLAQRGQPLRGLPWWARDVHKIWYSGCNIRVHYRYSQIIVPRRTPKTTTFGKKITSHGARLQPESRPTERRRRENRRFGAIWGDTPPKRRQNRLPRSRTPWDYY